MRKLFLTAAMMCGVSVSALAQTEFEHAQTRVQEGMSEFFVRPIVAELKMISNERQVYGPFNIYTGMSLNEITSAMLQDAKTNAAYKASQIAGADIILGATFYVVNNKKNKGLDVTVNGYPAKYVDFHSYGDKQSDEKWVEPLQNGARIRALTNQSQSQAISADTKK